jgi:hypothetical protein
MRVPRIFRPNPLQREEGWPVGPQKGSHDHDRRPRTAQVVDPRSLSLKHNDSQPAIRKSAHSVLVGCTSVSPLATTRSRTTPRDKSSPRNSVSMMNDDVRAVDNATIELHALGISSRKRRSIDPFSHPDPGQFEGLEFNNDLEIRTTSGSVSKETAEDNQTDH